MVKKSVMAAKTPVNKVDFNASYETAEPFVPSRLVVVPYSLSSGNERVSKIAETQLLDKISSDPSRVQVSQFMRGRRYRRVRVCGDALVPAPVVFLPAHLPSYQCQSELDIECGRRRDILVQKKVCISFSRGKPKLHSFPEFIGTARIDQLIAALKLNLESFLADSITDIRVAGSGANNILFGEPAEMNLRDIDLVVYLKYLPENREECLIEYLKNISRIFESTLASFVSEPLDQSILQNFSLLQVIHNYYLSNWVIVNDGKNLWFLTGTGLLDVRFCIVANREYSVTGYSFQVSLENNLSYCLCGDKEKAKRDFLEKRFVMPRPEDVPNCLVRTLYELNRHNFYEIENLIPIVDKDLESGSPDCFIAILQNHLLKAQFSQRTVSHIIYLLRAVYSGSSEDKIKEEVIFKGVLLLARYLKIEEVGMSFERLAEGIIIKMAELNFFYEASALLNLFCDLKPAQGSVCLLSLVEREISSPGSNTDYFEDLLMKLQVRRPEEINQIFIDLNEKAKRTGNLNVLSVLAEKSQLIPSFLDKKYSFYFADLIRSLSSAKEVNILQRAIELFFETRSLFSSDELFILKDCLIRSCVKEKKIPRELQQEFSDFFFVNDKSLVMEILDVVLTGPLNAEDETVDFAYNMLIRYKQTPSLTCFTESEEEKVIAIYEKRISYASSIDSFVNVIEEFTSNPLLFQNGRFTFFMVSRVAEVISSLNFINCNSVLKLMVKFLDDLKPTDRLLQENLKTIISALNPLLLRAAVFDQSFHNRTALIERSKGLFDRLRKIDLFSHEEVAKLGGDLSDLCFKMQERKEVLRYLLLSLPLAENKNYLAKKLSAFFFSLPLSLKEAVLKKNERFLALHLDTDNLSFFYLSILQCIEKPDESDSQFLSVFNFYIYLLERSFLLGLYFTPSFSLFLKNCISTFNPDLQVECFLREYEVLFGFVKTPVLNADVQCKTQFLLSSFAKFLSLSYQTEDKVFFGRAMEIFDSDLSLSQAFLPVLMAYLEKKSKTESPGYFLPILKKIAPQVKTLPRNCFSKELSLILINQKVNSNETLISYLELLGFLISLGIPLTRGSLIKPLEYQQSIITVAEADKTRRQQAFEGFSILQNSLFWNSPILGEIKRNLFCYLISLFVNNPKEIGKLYDFTSKELQQRSRIYPAKKDNPWLKLNAKDYEKIHSVIVSWLQAKNVSENLVNITKFYDLVRRFDVNKEETFQQKMTIYSMTFALLMAEYNEIKLDYRAEEQRVFLLAKSFIAWLRVVDKNLKTMSLENFKVASRSIAYNLWVHFISFKNYSSEIFYQIIKQAEGELSIDVFLQEFTGLSLNDFTLGRGAAVFPPQAIIQTIIKKRFPELCTEHRCFRDLYKD